VPDAEALKKPFLARQQPQQRRGHQLLTRLPARTDLAAPGPLKVHYVSARLAADFNRYEREFRDIFRRAP
jgi:hypothetical protein